MQINCFFFSQLTDSDHYSSDDAPKPNRDVQSEERPLDPFSESGLHLSLTAAEAKQKARAKRPNESTPYGLEQETGNLQQLLSSLTSESSPQS